MNIMSLFEGSWPEAMQSISDGTLVPADVPLRAGASLVLYLVSPDYAVRPGPPLEFTLEESTIEREGAHVFFSSAVRTGEGSYRTVGTSRALAIATTAPTLEQARVRVVRCARSVPELEWRADVGAEGYLEGLRGLVAPQHPGERPLLSRAL
jgi:phosphoribosylamine-glycine ligase